MVLLEDIERFGIEFAKILLEPKNLRLIMKQQDHGK
jgi:hypothetical protein